jgi:hypothetical protein
MPKYNVTNKANVLRTGNEVFPSYGALYREPVIRYKLNAAGTEVLILAQNPCNADLETVYIENNGGASWNTTIQLDGGWPTFGKITI